MWARAIFFMIFGKIDIACEENMPFLPWCRHFRFASLCFYTQQMGGNMTYWATSGRRLSHRSSKINVNPNRLQGAQAPNAASVCYCQLGLPFGPLW